MIDLVLFKFNSATFTLQIDTPSQKRKVITYFSFLNSSQKDQGFLNPNMTPIIGEG